MRTLAYFRESARAASLGEQNQAFLTYCRDHGLRVADTFAEGTDDPHGSAYARLIVELDQGKPSIVFIPELTTLADDLRSAAIKLFELRSLGSKVVTSGTDDALTQLLLDWVSDNNATRLSDKVRSAMRKKAVKGEVLGRPPYGYKVGPLRRLELVPDEAVVVRYIFRLYLQEGLGIRLIARRLNEEGVTTRRGGNWSMVSIRDILRNRAYLGTYARFNVRVSGSHPALVTTDDFRRVQDHMNARRSSPAPRAPSKFLLSGLAHCGDCGNRLIGVSRKQSWTRRGGERVQNTYRYYQCESRTNQSICSYNTRRAEALEDEVRLQLAQIAPSPNDATQPTTEQTASGERAAEKHRARLKVLDRKLERLVEAAARGRIARPQLEEEGLAIARERRMVGNKLATASRTKGESPNRSGGVERLVSDWDVVTFDERKSLVGEIVKRIDVQDDGVLISLW